ASDVYKRQLQDDLRFAGITRESQSQVVHALLVLRDDGRPRRGIPRASRGHQRFLAGRAAGRIFPTVRLHEVEDIP
ncbi:MAG: hypothetical protein QUU85_19375, partial [Candidatus Eisenbacteria bacterium]|nr:hypothetical protein [Candidatus Eisenbacteria bacterium]